MLNITDNLLRQMIEEKTELKTENKNVGGAESFFCEGKNYSKRNQYNKGQ